MTLQGLTYVLTGNQTINYPNMTVALGLNAPLADLFSVRSVVGIGGIRARRGGDALHPARP